MTQMTQITTIDNIKYLETNNQEAASVFIGDVVFYMFENELYKGALRSTGENIFEVLDEHRFIDYWDKIYIPLTTCKRILAWTGSGDKIMVNTGGDFCTWEIYCELKNLEVTSHIMERRRSVFTGPYSPRLITMSEGKEEIIKEIINA